MPEAIAGAGTAAVPGAGAGSGAGAGGSDSGGGVATEIDPGAGEGGTEGTGTGAGEGEGAPGDAGAGDGEGDGEGAGEPGEGSGEGEPADGEGEGDEADADFDGRNIEDKTRKALAKLKKIDPVVAKELANTYHRTQRIIKDTGSKTLSEAVNKVAANVAVIESLGGHEGIQNLQSEVTDYRKEITQFAEGDPALITQLYDAQPDGLVNSLIASIDFLASKDVERFKSAVRPAVVARLQQAGMAASLKNVAALLTEAKGQEAYDLVQKIAAWVTNEESQQEKAIKTRAEKNPERERLENDRREFEQTKAKEYDRSITVDVNSLNNSSLKEVVEPFFRAIKLTDAMGKRKFEQAVLSDIWTAMREDKTFQMQANAIKNKGNAKETAEFLNAKFAELLPTHFRLNRNALYPNYRPMKKPAAKPAAAATATNGAKPGAAKPAAVAAAAGADGIIKIAAGQRPKHDDVSWDTNGGKTTMIDWMRGFATLKNGRRVQFDPNAPPNSF